jgi:uncharacterized protein
MIEHALDTETRTRRDALHELLRSFASVCVGYSGGVDSVYLAKAAVDVLGDERVLAVTGRSAAYPAVQRDLAIECSRAFGIPHLEIATDELDDPAYTANPTDRCYHCKTELWSKLGTVAAARGLAVVLDGSNADDVTDYRPGMRAATEARVRSPLLEVGLTKNQIRALSRVEGLPTWDSPSAPCLSSRLPYGIAVTRERLAHVEHAEDAVRSLGFREFRVRHHGSAARLEFAPPELPRAATRGADLSAAVVGAGFGRVLLDVEGYRRGALNETNELVGLSPRRWAGALSARDVAVADAAWRVESAGQHADIAVVDADASQVDAVRIVADEIRRRGYRYVAIDLARTSAPTHTTHE